jgi:outer membrane receptor protein involved in Fe transport
LLIFNAPGPVFAVGHNVDNLQHQLNIVDAVSVVRGAHQIKAGIDYRRLTPVLNVLTYGETVNFSPAGLLSGLAVRTAIQSNPVTRHPLFTDFSAYVQDVWRTSGRFTLTAGLRWDVNPPPSDLSGHAAYTVLGLENPATMTLAPKGTPLWNTSYANFAPRLGVAYQLSDASDRESVLRGGFGVFYDLGSGPIGSTFGQGAFPYTAMTVLSNVAFPLDATQAQPPQVNPGPPYGSLVVAVSRCRAPTRGAPVSTAGSPAINSSP